MPRANFYQRHGKVQLGGANQGSGSQFGDDNRFPKSPWALPEQLLEAEIPAFFWQITHTKTQIPIFII